MTRFVYINIHISLKILKTFPCCTVIWKCSCWSRHVCRFSPVCASQSARCMPCFLPVLVGVWTATVSIKVHCLCLCVWLQMWETELQRAAHVAARLSVGLWLACVQCCGCSNVQTVSFHWWCMAVRAFRSVCFCNPLMHLAWSGRCMYRSCVPSLLAHLPFAFCSPAFLYTPSSCHSHLRASYSSLLRRFVTYVLPFCVPPRQPALELMHNVEALHFNEQQQLFKANVLVGVIWRCMNQS